MRADPYAAIMPVWLVLLISVVLLVVLFLIVGCRRLEWPRQIEAHERTNRRPGFVDGVREGWHEPTVVDADLDARLEAAWTRFEAARTIAHRRRHLSVVDQRTQSALYPGTVPAHKIYPNGGAA